jgi:hypothetical protein
VSKRAGSAEKEAAARPQVAKGAEAEAVRKSAEEWRRYGYSEDWLAGFDAGFVTGIETGKRASSS